VNKRTSKNETKQKKNEQNHDVVLLQVDEREKNQKSVKNESHDDVTSTLQTGTTRIK